MAKEKSREECLTNLREAIALILEHRREESLRSLPPDAGQELGVVGYGCVLRREGREHTLWESPQTGHAEAVPRYAEIANLLVKRICRRLSIADPPG